MSQESGVTEDKQRDATGLSMQADQSGGRPSAIHRLYEKLNAAQTEKPGASSELPSGEEKESALDAQPSVINRLFEKVTHHRLEAMDPVERPRPITRITQTEIKAMKCVETTADSKPEVLVRKQCVSSVTNLWTEIAYYFHSLFDTKSK